jgi:hypothetical protein
VFLEGLHLLLGPRQPALKVGRAMGLKGLPEVSDLLQHGLNLS